MTMKRRELLIGVAAALGQPELRATPAEVRLAIYKLAGGAPVREGRVRVDLPPLVENGNSVPLAVHVDSPMSAADHVKAIHVFVEKNPLPAAVSFFLGPRSGRAEVSTRIRLADSQTVSVVCEMSDGSFWSGRAESVVTAAACAETV